jgi:opacity protein-like surface antigen
LLSLPSILQAVQALINKRGMKVKKVLLSALGIMSSAALATAGNAKMHTAAPAINSANGIYIEGLAGYNRYAFSNTGTPNNVVPTQWHNGFGNVALGADIGYQFQRYFSVELGGIYTFYGSLEPQNKIPGAPDTMKLQPSYAYLAGKVSTPIYNNFSAFAKLGAGYQQINVTDDGKLFGEDIGNASYLGLMLGAGIAYHITPAVYVSGEWLHFANGTSLDNNVSVATPAPNLFLLGVGYKFTM